MHAMTADEMLVEQRLEELLDKIARIEPPKPKRSGRGPAGKLRNFRAMKTAKLREVALTIATEHNDREALVAATTELGTRFA